MNKLLVDTNVLIYSTNLDSEFYKETHEFLEDSTYELFTTSKNLIEYLSVVTRIPSNPLRIDSALAIVKNFKEIFNILYPSNDSFIIFEDLVSKYKPKGLRLHDFEIISIAVANDIDLIYTFNRIDFSEVEEISLISS